MLKNVEKDTIQKLKDHPALATINHEEEIMKETTLKKLIYIVL